jgi:MerR family mercuric resistance operon transcriptional regulator
VGIETIRYYEREGLAPKLERALNIRRIYCPYDVGRLRFLKNCRNLGFTLADAKKFLNFPEATARITDPSKSWLNSMSLVCALE